MNISKTKKLTTIAMLCALAYIAAAVGRIPIVLFLRYDSKDVGECREGQYPAALQRCKFDAPLLAAGLLTLQWQKR